MQYFARLFIHDLLYIIFASFHPFYPFALNLYTTKEPPHSCDGSDRIFSFRIGYMMAVRLIHIFDTNVRSPADMKTFQ